MSFRQKRSQMVKNDSNFDNIRILGRMMLFCQLDFAKYTIF